MIGLFLLAAAHPATTCHQVSGEHLRIADLTSAEPRFAQVPDQEATVGYAPTGSARRVLGGEELLRIARQNGMDAAERFAPVCFERAASPLQKDNLLRALSEALGNPGADIELVDFSRYPVAAGVLRFERKHLSAPPDSKPNEPVYWRGDVVQQNGKSSGVWAKVKITAQQQRVVAARYLKAGTVLQISDLRMEQYSGFPQHGDTAQRLDQLIGHELKSAQRSGSALLLGKVTEASDVNRGDRVRVIVTNGAAHLELEGDALANGHKGEVISIRNPNTKKLFLARISGKSAVEVTGEALRAAR